MNLAKKHLIIGPGTKPSSLVLKQDLSHAHRHFLNRRRRIDEKCHLLREPTLGAPSTGRNSFALRLENLDEQPAELPQESLRANLEMHLQDDQTSHPEPRQAGVFDLVAAQSPLSPKHASSQEQATSQGSSDRGLSGTSTFTKRPKPSSKSISLWTVLKRRKIVDLTISFSSEGTEILIYTTSHSKFILRGVRRSSFLFGHDHSSILALIADLDYRP